MNPPRTSLKNKKPHTASDILLSAAILVCLAIVFGLISFYMPQQLDDNIFRDIYRTCNGGSLDFSFGAWYDFVMEIRANDNSRLSNIMQPIFANFSPWHELFPWLTGIMVALMAAMTTRLAGYSLRRPLPLALVTGMLVVFLPWRNSIMLMDYSLNYIYSTVLTLVWTAWLLDTQRRGWSLGAVFGLSLFGAITGAWHEGFALPVIAGLCVWTLMRRGRMPWQWYTVAGVYALAAAIFALSPGILTRLDYEVTYIAYRDYSMRYITMMAVPLLLLVSLGVCLCRSRLRRRLRALNRDARWVVFLTAALVSSLLTLLVNNTLRTAFFPVVTSTLALVALWRRPVTEAADSRWGRALSWVFLAVLALHGAVNVWWQKRLNSEYDCVIDACRRSPDGTVYHDILCRRGLPLYTLRIPQRNGFDDSYQMLGLRRFYRKEGFKVLPTVMRHARPQDAVALNDSVYRYHDFLMARLPEHELDQGIYTARMNLVLADGTRVSDAPVHTEIFTGADSCRYCYIYPYNFPVSAIADARFCYKLLMGDVPGGH